MNKYKHLRPNDRLRFNVACKTSNAWRDGFVGWNKRVDFSVKNYFSMPYDTCRTGVWHVTYDRLTDVIQAYDTCQTVIGKPVVIAEKTTVVCK